MRRSAVGSSVVGAAAVVSGVPHSPQNFVPGAFDVPHAGHATASAVPHSPQNLRPASFDVPHAGQSTIRLRMAAAKYRVVARRGQRWARAGQAQPFAAPLNQLSRCARMDLDAGRKRPRLRRGANDDARSLQLRSCVRPRANALVPQSTAARPRPAQQPVLPKGSPNPKGRFL